MFNNIHLGIVCPMANEIGTAVRFVDDVLAVCANRDFASVRFFAVLDNVSHDGTREALQKRAENLQQLAVVWAPENRCVVDAYVRGYREALNRNCGWILEIDAGYSHRPQDIPQFFDQMSKGFDCVFGSRIMTGGDMRDSPLSRRILSRGGSVLSKMVLGTPLKDMTSGFQLFSRTAMLEILDRGIKSRGPFFQTEMKAYCRNMKFVEVPIVYAGASHSIKWPAIKDSFQGLWRLRQLKAQGRL